MWTMIGILWFIGQILGSCLFQKTKFYWCIVTPIHLAASATTAELSSHNRDILAHKA